MTTKKEKTEGSAGPITPKPVPGKPRPVPKPTPANAGDTKSPGIGHNSKQTPTQQLLKDVANSDKAGVLEIFRDTVLDIEGMENQKKEINKAIREKKNMLKRNGVKIGTTNNVLRERKLDAEVSKANRQEVDALLDYMEDQYSMDFDGADNGEKPQEAA